MSKSEPKVSAAAVAEVKAELDQRAIDVPRALARGEEVPRDLVEFALIRLGNEKFDAEVVLEGKRIRLAALREEHIPLQAEHAKQDAESWRLDAELRGVKARHIEELKIAEAACWTQGRVSGAALTAMAIKQREIDQTAAELAALGG